MQKVMEMLETSRKEFHAATEGVGESQARVRPEAGRWSVLECVEHVTLVEGMFLGWLESAGQNASPPDPQREAELAATVASRATPAQAPEPVQPTGRFGTLAEALKQFDAARARTVRFAEERAADLYSLATEHPRRGRMNGVELLTVTSAHTLRHTAQIREVRKAVGV